jgi:hypothetical protein
MYLCRCVSRHTRATWFSLWVLHAFEPLESVWTKFSSDRLICLSRWSFTLMIEPKYKYFQQKIKRVIEWQRPLSCTKEHQRAFGEILMDIGNKYKRESSIVFTFFFFLFFWVDCLLLFFLWVVSTTCVLFCLILLRDGFPSLIYIYSVFLLLLEAWYDLVIDEPPTEMMSNFTFGSLWCKGQVREAGRKDR